MRAVKDRNLLDEFCTRFCKILECHTRYPLTGLSLWFNPLSHAIAFKEEYLKSDKDLEDAQHLRIVYSEQIHEPEIRRIKTAIRRLRL